MPPVASVTPTPWSGNALTVLRRRYLRKDAEGRICETPDELLHRVARAVAAAEARYGGKPELVEAQFFDSLARLELLPNSPTYE